MQYDDTGTLPQYKRYDPYCAEPAESFYREDDRGDEYRSIDYWTDGRGSPQRASDALQTWMRTDLLNQVNVLMSNLTVGVINVVKELCYVLIGVIVSVYVLFSKEKFASQCKKLVYAIMRPSRANMVLHLTIKSNEIFGGFIIGKIIDSAIIGVLCFVGLSILDMPYTMLVSVIVGVTNVIPFFGPYIGAIPSAVLYFVVRSEDGNLILLFLYFFCSSWMGISSDQRFLGDSTGLSAFWVVFSILFGGGMFGFVGMIFGSSYICSHLLYCKNAGEPSAGKSYAAYRYRCVRPVRLCK